MREVELVALLGDDEPVFVLKDKNSFDAVPIWIAEPEFTSIAIAWRGGRFPRPLSHDLTCGLLEALGARLARVEISEIKEGVFYAKVYVSRDGEEPKAVDARPSDAIALALRTKSPIFVAEEVFAQAGVEWNLKKILLPRRPEETAG
ncbi:MAG: bifunctional nuclease family protein [Candidatus Bipolaricaulota bacterium]|nr:bifunctional nuclease family protein [Candidatus Bipolaricaulota bacterium]MCX7844168.1 bifunctional nuclease family protein [Candidatus Bipolaricaulota bacterium]MDW8152244.1 bifunctional nuclease family protein [Candidatus Bipolaricaulota bacterium]